MIDTSPTVLEDTYNSNFGTSQWRRETNRPSSQAFSADASSLDLVRLITLLDYPSNLLNSSFASKMLAGTSSLLAPFLNYSVPNYFNSVYESSLSELNTYGSNFDNKDLFFEEAIRKYALQSLRSTTYAKNVSDRLKQLLESFRKERSEDNDNYDPQYSSIINFIDFMSAHKNLSKPNLSLTPNGRITANWRNNVERVHIHFESDDTVRFIFKYLDEDSDRIQHQSGYIDLAILYKSMNAILGVGKRWIFDENR